MNISNIFENGPDLEIDEIMTDSRKQGHNAIFFCIKGMVNDGHDFVRQAVTNGAICVVHSRELEEYQEGVTYLMVEDTMRALNEFAAIFYGSPSEKMKVYGVTGTNGKSTIAWVTRYMVNNFVKCGYVGTIGVVIDKDVYDSPLTTPDTVYLHKMFREMYDQGCRAVSMEVSSIGLEEHRVDTIDFDVVSFTNLTHDHLDYHGNFDNYYKAKKKLFTMVGSDKTAVINIDDPYGELLRRDSNARVVTYALERAADYQAVDVQLFPDHTEFSILYKGEKYPVFTNLVARFNVYNLLNVLAVLHEDGYTFEQLIPLCRTIPQVLGRMENIVEGQNFTMLIDYAHTPDGFEKVFEYARAITKPNHRIIVVFGSAGARDARKRSELGRIADENCSVIILTSEDPRHEDPAQIAEAIRSGITRSACLFIKDRYFAIRQGIELAQEGDTVMVLGKGDEDYMDVEGKKEHWMGDQNAAHEILREIMEERGEENEA